MANRTTREDELVNVGVVQPYNIELYKQPNNGVIYLRFICPCATLRFAKSHQSIFQCAFAELHILRTQFGIYRFKIAHRIDTIIYVHNLREAFDRRLMMYMARRTIVELRGGHVIIIEQ